MCFVLCSEYGQSTLNSTNVKSTHVNINITYMFFSEMKSAYTKRHRERKRYCTQSAQGNRILHAGWDTQCTRWTCCQFFCSIRCFPFGCNMLEVDVLKCILHLIVTYSNFSVSVSFRLCEHQLAIWVKAKWFAISNELR